MNLRRRYTCRRAQRKSRNRATLMVGSYPIGGKLAASPGLRPGLTALKKHSPVLVGS
jgi:hypothetical protein